MATTAITKTQFESNVMGSINGHQTLTPIQKQNCIKAFQAVTAALAPGANINANTAVAVARLLKEELDKQVGQPNMDANVSIEAVNALFCSVPQAWIPEDQEVKYGSIRPTQIVGLEAAELQTIIQAKAKNVVLNPQPASNNELQNEIDSLRAKMKK